MSFSAHDPLALGIVGIGPSGFDMLSSSSSSAASTYITGDMMRDAGVRRKKISDMIFFLKSNMDKPPFAYEELLKEHKLDHLDQNIKNMLYKDLISNPKIICQSAHFSYRSLHTGLSNKDDLLRYIGKFNHGIPQDELSDAYLNVMRDIEQLVENNDIYRLEYKEKKKHILFPRFRQYEPKEVIDEDIKKMWQQVEMPKSQYDLESRLYMAGHISASQFRTSHIQASRLMQQSIQMAAIAKQQATIARKAERKRKTLMRITNTHLQGQSYFFGANGAASNNNQQQNNNNQSQSNSAATSSTTKSL